MLVVIPCYLVVLLDYIFIVVAYLCFTIVLLYYSYISITIGFFVFCEI